MTDKRVFKKNRNFYIGIAGTVVKGLLSGSLFLLLCTVMQLLWSGTFDLSRALKVTGLIAVIFFFRIVIYSFGYTRAQIGGAAVSRQIRLFLGDKIKRIPLSRFSKGQTGEYISVLTSDVNNYEKILTHKIGDLAKNISLSLMLIGFVMTLYVPAGLILLAADLLLIPALYLSFYMARKYGNEKNDICAENVSSIVEYVSGIQTFRAYGIGGTKNKTVTKAMKDFCDISFLYEAKVLPIGAVCGILIWLACPLIIWLAYTPWAAGTLDTISYLLICMLPIFCAKMANAIFVDLTGYKNLMISKGKIKNVAEEPEETGSRKPFQPGTHEITFDHVAFSYVPGEPVLTDVSFTAPDQKLTAIVGASGAGEAGSVVLCAEGGGGGGGAGGAEAVDDEGGGEGGEAGGEGGGGDGCAGEAVGVAAAGAVEVGVGVGVAAQVLGEVGALGGAVVVGVRGAAEFVLDGAGAVVDGVDEAALHEEGECARDGGAVDGLQGVLDLERGHERGGIVEGADG